MNTEKILDIFATALETEGLPQAAKEVRKNNLDPLGQYYRAAFNAMVAIVNELAAEQPLSFDHFRLTNLRRCVEGFGHELGSWNVAEWGNATNGEMGEAIGVYLSLLTVRDFGNAGNIAKKLLRFRDNVKGNLFTADDYRKHLAEEIAGAVIYADLWSASQGINLGEAIKHEFNKKSDELGSPIKL